MVRSQIKLSFQLWPFHIVPSLVVFHHSISCHFDCHPLLSSVQNMSQIIKSHIRKNTWSLVCWRTPKLAFCQLMALVKWFRSTCCKIQFYSCYNQSFCTVNEFETFQMTALTLARTFFRAYALTGRKMATHQRKPLRAKSVVEDSYR